MAAGLLSRFTSLFASSKVAPHSPAGRQRQKPAVPRPAHRHNPRRPADAPPPPPHTPSPANGARSAASLSSLVAPGNETVILGEPITAIGGMTIVSDAAKGFCAIFADGTAWVHHSHQNDAEVQTAIDRAKRHMKDPVTGKPITLKLTTIDSMAKIAEAYGTQAAASSGDLTVLRARFQDMLDLAAAYLVSEIQIKLAGEHAQVRFVVNETLSNVIDEFDRDVAEKMFTAIYNWSDTNDGSIVATSTQLAAINKPSKLPPGVFTVRMIFKPLADGRLLKMRVSYRDHVLIKGGLAAAGLMPETLQVLQQCQTMNRGLVTFSGPIGSGKTTLGTAWLIAVSEYHDNRWFILSAEDPPEGLDDRIASVAVTDNDDPGVDPYDQELRDAKRLFPQLIRIGECRTKAATRSAYSASLFGKTLVQTTLHADETLDIPETYVTLGLTVEEAYDHHRHGGWINQRLIPRICSHCARDFSSPDVLADPLLKEAYDAFCAAIGVPLTSKLKVRGNGKLPNGSVCPHCRPRNPRVCGSCDRPERGPGCACPAGTQGMVVVGMPGIIGRIPAAEALRPTKELMDLLRKPGGKDEARRYWLTTMRGKSLRMHAWQHLKDGIIGAQEFLETGITPEQLAFDLRVTGAIA